MSSIDQHRTGGPSRVLAGMLPVSVMPLASAVCLLGLALAMPAVAQPPLVLPLSLSECSGASIPCITFSYPHLENNFILNEFQARGKNPVDSSPVLTPPAEYYDVTFSNIPSGYSIQNGDYVAWATDINVLNIPVQPGELVQIFDTFAKSPPAPWNNYGPQYSAVNWLLNHKPTVITYQTGCDSTGNNCTGTATASDSRTIRDVIQQVIWMLFDGGTPYCCSLPDTGVAGSPPTNPQYNATFVFDNFIGNSGGGYNIASCGTYASGQYCVGSLYTEALNHTDFVPGPGGVFAIFALDSTGVMIELPLAPPPQLTVVKSPKLPTDPNGTFLPQGQATFSIKVTNTGGTAATNVQVTDTLPTNGGLAWATATPTQGTCTLSGTNNSVLNCALGTVNPGTANAVTITVTSTATTPMAACQTQPNGQPGPPIVPGVTVTGDNGLSAVDWGSLTCAVPPLLTVVKSPKLPTDTGGTFPYQGQGAFKIVVTNIGGSAATHVVVNDILPILGSLAWLAVTSTQPSCTLSGTNNSVLKCSLGTINPGAANAVTINVTTTATTPAAACQTQPNGSPGVPGVSVMGDNGLSAIDWGSMTCTCQQLSVVKTPKNAIFTAGQPITFTFVVSNPGCQADTNVKLSDVLSTTGGLTWTLSPANSACTITSNVLNCSWASIAPGNANAQTVTVTTQNPTPLPACDPVLNTVSVSADGGLTAVDSGSYNCTPPQLTVVKAPKGGTFFKDQQASFTILVSDPAPAGSSPATNVQVTDTLPTAGNLSWATAATSQGTCTLSGTNNSHLSCSLGTIAAGPTNTVTIVINSTEQTPDSACVEQDNGRPGPPIVPGVVATADGGLTATDYGWLQCDAPPPDTQCGPYRVKYASNLNIGESYITIGNEGANGASQSGLGAVGNICANVYTFDPAEEMVSCCSCLITPDQVRYLRVKQDLLSNLIGGVNPTSVTIKLVSTLAGVGGTGTNCTNSAAAIDTESIVPGMFALGTTLHANSVSGGYDTTETPFGCPSLSTGEINSLANRCRGIVGELSGFGICGPCRALP